MHDGQQRSIRKDGRSVGVCIYHFLLTWTLSTWRRATRGKERGRFQAIVATFWFMRALWRVGLLSEVGERSVYSHGEMWIPLEEILMQT